MSFEVKPVCWRLSQFDVTFTSLSGHSWPLLSEFNRLLIRDVEKGLREGEKKEITWRGGREPGTLCVKREGRRRVSVIGLLAHTFKEQHVLQTGSTS